MNLQTLAVIVSQSKVTVCAHFTKLLLGLFVSKVTCKLQVYIISNTPFSNSIHSSTNHLLESTQMNKISGHSHLIQLHWLPLKLHSVTNCSPGPVKSKVGVAPNYLVNQKDGLMEVCSESRGWISLNNVF